MKVSVDSIGCRLNQAEMRALGWQLEEHGIQLVQDFEDSDLIVINTCTVTAPAAADSRSRIRTVLKKNPGARVIATGCWVTMEEEAAEQLAGTGNVVPNDQKDSILDLILETAGLRDHTPARPASKPAFRRTRAFIKVQDGCSSRCSYCITTIARGPAVSVPVERVIEQIRRETDFGAMEVVLTGVQLNHYGSDLPGINLSNLVRATLTSTDIPRLRLSSVEPWGLPEDFTELWDSPRMCRHLHLPLQSGCTATLKRMRRPYSAGKYARLVERILEAVPDIAISTDIITGFPGETEDEFAESLHFVRETKFAHGHVFSYSPRPHTHAEQLPGKVTERIIKERTQQMRAVIQEKINTFRKAAINSTVDVLWEKAEYSPGNGWLLTGWSDNYLRVQAESGLDRRNTISQVELLNANTGILEGHILDERKCTA